jgi:Domain of unknown function (DUF4157)
MPTSIRTLFYLSGILLSFLLSCTGAPTLIASDLNHGTGGSVMPWTSVALKSFNPDEATSPQRETLPQTLSAVLGPSLAIVIRQDRDRTYPNGHPMPKEIRHKLTPFFPRALLQKVRYSTEWSAAAGSTLYQLLLGTGAVEAVTFADVIVFRDEQCARDPLLWAHELVHVEQYRRLGVEAFATQYLQQPWVIEREAVAKANVIKGKLAR